MSTECDIDKDYEVFLDGKLLVAKLDCTPSFIGGIDYLNRILAKEFMLSFYLKSKSKRKSNQVFRFNSEVLKINNKFSILVKKDGTIGDLKSRGSNVNLDLIRFIEKEIKNYKNQWISGELNGEKVDAYLDLVIRLHISY